MDHTEHSNSALKMFIDPWIHLEWLNCVFFRESVRLEKGQN